MSSKVRADLESSVPWHRQDHSVPVPPDLHQEWDPNLDPVNLDPDHLLLWADQCQCLSPGSPLRRLQIRNH